MSSEMFVVTALIVTIAALVQGSAGLGFALIVTPMVGLIDPALLPVLVLVLMVPLNGYVVWRERYALDVCGAGWITVGRTVGTFGGLWVLLVIPPSGLSLLIGGSSVLAALGSLLVPSFVPARRALVAVGALTGITETATGIGGPPLVLAYQHRPAPELRSTVALCFLIGEVLSLGLLGATGQVGSTQLRTALLLLPMVGLGALLSRAVHKRLDGPLMRAIVLSFALVSGVAVIVQGWMN